MQTAVAGAAAQPQLFITGDQFIGIGGFRVEAQQKRAVLFEGGGGFPQQGGDGFGIVGVTDGPAGGIGKGAPCDRRSKNNAECSSDFPILLQIDLLTDPTFFDICPAAVLHQVAPRAAADKGSVAGDGVGIILLQDRHGRFSFCKVVVGQG